MHRLLLALTFFALPLIAQQSAPNARTGAVTPSEAQTKPQRNAEILNLGTYHMANHGHDIYNMNVDDVLSPERQQQMAQLIEVLKKFHPTKITIEASVGSKKVDQQYADYLAGKYTLTRNEDDQIGYRLGKELGHAKIYSVDEDGDFPWLRVIDYEKAHGHGDTLDQLNAESEKSAKEENASINSHSVLENLLRVNSDAHVAKDLAWYYTVERMGEPYDYAGPDLLASWYQRNIRIYHNIVNLIDSPNGNCSQERILVIYGYGHLGWLRQIAQQDPSVKLRKLEEFAK